LGVLIKGPEVLESTRTVDTIVLDKTGTVTTGEMELHDVVTAPGEDPAVLAAVAGLESGSEHPIAKAIVAGARRRGVDPDAVPIAEFRNHEGLGVEGVVGGRSVLVGRRSLLESHGVVLDDGLLAAVDEAQAAGRTPVLGAVDGVLRVVAVVADSPRATSATAIRELRRLGLTPVLLTGDNERAARSVAQQVGIDEVVAEVLPADKVATV